METGQNREGESTPVTIARMAVESFVRTGRFPSVAEVPQFGKEMAGCFVSLHRDGALRGCIGTILPTKECVASEIIRNAVSSCSEDPRFDPVRPEELQDLEISVDVLDPPEKVDSPESLDPKRFGVIVTSGVRRGLLLPDLEGVESVDDQLEIACRKAGIQPGERYSIERFTVTRYR